MPKDVPWLQSEETGVAFSHCVHCRLPLLEIDAPFLVTKEYRRGECVLEYALCQRCRDRLADRFCPASKQAVRQFLENEIDWDARVKDFMMDATLRRRIEACIACRTPRDQAQGFVLSALFDSGGELITGPLPLILCSLCTQRLMGQLTPETLAVWQSFIDTHFAGPPDDDGSCHGHLGLF